MNTVDYNNALFDLAARLEGAVSSRALAIALAQQALAPAALNGENIQHMRTRAAKMMTAVREAEEQAEGSRRRQRLGKLRAQAARFFRVDGDGGPVTG